MPAKVQLLLDVWRYLLYLLDNHFYGPWTTVPPDFRYDDYDIAPTLMPDYYDFEPAFTTTFTPLTTTTVVPILTTAFGDEPELQMPLQIRKDFLDTWIFSTAVSGYRFYMNYVTLLLIIRKKQNFSGRVD